MIEALTSCDIPVFKTAAVAEAPPRVTDAARKWSTFPGGVVDGGEIVVFAIKPSMWRPVFDSAPWLVVTCLLATVLAEIRAPLPGLSVAATAQVVMLVGLIRLGVAVVRWVPSWYVLTNRRVIDIQGVRSPRIWACPLVEVRNTYLSHTSAETMALLGSITFITDHPDSPPHIWRSIASADEVHAKIRRAIENAIDRYSISA
ncbi:MAG: hypothetical protein JSU63_20210 [Phycisphaerales bacterium]|nr:MAG: hypothetical protein JSU63_20210 [Phycisphaerales bacterium]